MKLFMRKSFIHTTSIKRVVGKAALEGVRVLEMAGLAPVPFCGMLLADFGAQVIRVDRATGEANAIPDTKLGRGKQSVAIDLKRPEGRDILMRLADKVDVVLEPFRAGVMEKLGLGPDVLLKRNPRLIYTRLTGHGSTGPLSTHASHDINYLSYSGLLWSFGSPGSNPRWPVNLMADFAGGGLLCSFAITSALFQRSVTGRGQVIEVNTTQGAAYIATWLWSSRSEPYFWSNPGQPGKNLIDGGRAFYNTYKTKDGGFVAVGAIEPRFYKALLKALGVNDPKSFQQNGDQAKLYEKFQAIFNQHDRNYWVEVAKNNPDACLSPVLTLNEAPEHQHARVTGAFLRKTAEQGGGYEPAPSPRSMSIFAGGDKSAPPDDPKVGQHTRIVLSSLLKMTNSEIDQLHEKKIIASN